MPEHISTVGIAVRCHSIPDTTQFLDIPAFHDMSQKLFENLPDIVLVIGYLLKQRSRLSLWMMFHDRPRIEKIHVLQMAHPSKLYRCLMGKFRIHDQRKPARPQTSFDCIFPLLRYHVKQVGQDLYLHPPVMPVGKPVFQDLSGMSERLRIGFAVIFNVLHDLALILTLLFQIAALSAGLLQLLLNVFFLLAKSGFHRLQKFGTDMPMRQFLHGVGKTVAQIIAQILILDPERQSLTDMIPLTALVPQQFLLSLQRFKLALSGPQIRRLDIHAHLDQLTVDLFNLILEFLFFLLILRKDLIQFLFFLFLMLQLLTAGAKIQHLHHSTVHHQLRFQFFFIDPRVTHKMQQIDPVPDVLECLPDLLKRTKLLTELCDRVSLTA